MFVKKNTGRFSLTDTEKKVCEIKKIKKKTMNTKKRTKIEFVVWHLKKIYDITKNFIVYF